MKVTIYKHTEDFTPNLIEAEAIFKFIKEGRWKEQVDVLREMYINYIMVKADKGEKAPETIAAYDAYQDKKKTLPCIQFGGEFTYRKAEDLRHYSHLLVADADKLTKEKLSKLKEALKLNPKVFAFFVSPSNSGIKVLFRNSGQPDSHKQAHTEIKKYFLDEYDIKIDSLGNNFSCLCYASYDPELYFNPESEWFFSVETIAAREKFANKTTTKIDVKESAAGGDFATNVLPMIFEAADLEAISKKIGTTFKHAFRICMMWTAKHFEFVEGQRNHYVHALACNCNRVGIPFFVCTDLCKELLGQLPAEEIESTCKSAYDNNKAEHFTSNLFDRDKKELEEVKDPNWNEEAKNVIIELLQKNVDKKTTKILLGSYYLASFVGCLTEITEQEFNEIYKTAWAYVNNKKGS